MIDQAAEHVIVAIDATAAAATAATAGIKHDEQIVATERRGRSVLNLFCCLGHRTQMHQRRSGTSRRSTLVVQTSPHRTYLEM
jgi:hypothetical protein